MRSQRAVFRSVIGQTDGLSVHVAALARGEITRIEGKRVALGKLRVLPFVVCGKRANPFIVVELRRQVRLVACGAEFRCGIKVLHHGLSVPVEMCENLSVGNDARYAVPLFIHHHRRHTHHKTAVSELRVCFLDRVTGHAG